MLTDLNIASSIPHLVSFLLNYSVSRHSHLKPQSILEPSLVQDLTQHGDQMVRDTISILKFQEHFYHTIFLQPRANDSLLIPDQHVIPKLFGFFATIVALMLDIVPEDLHSQMFPTGFDSRRLMLGENPSTIEHFAFLILSLYSMDVQHLNLDYITASNDLELKLSLGLEMARYRRALEASAVLGLCVKEMETVGCISSRECCIITTELVKCYNMMSEEAKAEKVALQVLGSQRDPQLKFQQDLCHLNVALADTLMGQGEYESAESLMLDVLTVDSLPRPTQTVIRLRLNKARRRLERGQFIASVKADIMQPILETVADLSRDLKVEVLAELSATVSLAPKQKDPVFEELKSLCHDAVAAMSASHDVTDDWRIPALEQELGRLEGYTPKRRGFEDTGLRNVGLRDAHQPYPEVWNAAEKESYDRHFDKFSEDLDRPWGRSYTGMLGRLFSRRTHPSNSDKWFERLRSSLNQTSLAGKPKRKNFRSYLNLLGRLLPQNRSSFEDPLYEMGGPEEPLSLIEELQRFEEAQSEPFELEARVPTGPPNPIESMLPSAWWINSNGPDSRAFDSSDGFQPTEVLPWWEHEGLPWRGQAMLPWRGQEMLRWREREGRDEVDTSEYVSTLEVVPQEEREGLRKWKYLNVYPPKRLLTLWNSRQPQDR